MGKIFQSLQTELPDGEVKSAMDKAVEEMNSIMTSESDPFNVSNFSLPEYLYTLLEIIRYIVFLCFSYRNF